MTGARLVVFDLDGTLVDSTADLATAVNLALRHFAPAVPPLPHDVVRSYIGSGASRLLERSLRHAGLAVPVDEVRPVFLTHYERHLLDTTRLYPGVEDVLSGLAPRPLAVLTNKPGDMSRRILEGLGVAARFLRVCGAGDGIPHKPDPAGLLWLAEQAGARPEDTALVGDSAIDVRTARAAAAFAIGVRYGFDPGSFAADPPDVLVDTPGELLAAVEGLAAPRRA